MIGALVRKEARLQLPFLILIAVMIVLGSAEPLIEDDLELTSAKELGQLIVNEEMGSSLLFFVLIFSFAVGLLVREVDEKTQEFVDALPVSRPWVFAAKVGFALCALGLLPIDQVLSGGLRFWLSASSLRPSVPWEWLFAGAVITAVQVASVFGFGLVLSFARPFSWIAAGTVFWLYQLVKRFWPGVEVLDPFAIGRGLLEQPRLVWPVSALLVQTAVAAGLHAIALVLFLREPAVVVEAAAPRRRRWALVPLTAVVGISVLAFAFEAGEKPAPEGTMTRAQYATAFGRTRHYQVSYPSGLADRAALLLGRADAVHDLVAGALEVPAAETTTIAVDAGGSRLGTAGITVWTKIRLDLASTDRLADLEAVLGHETAHVYVARRSGGVLEEDQDSAALFQEGLATFLEYRLFRDAEALAQLRLQAAAIFERHQLPFETLLDRDAMVARYGTEHLYPLGERFFSALVARHGMRAVHGLLAAMADARFPRHARGKDRWRVAFQGAGLDLEVEVGAFEAALRRDATALRAELDALPSLQADARFEEGDLVLDLGAHVPEGYALACRFRRTARTPETEYVRTAVVQARGCVVPLASLPRRPFDYQLGLIELGTNRQLWDRWTRLD